MAASLAVLHGALQRLRRRREALHRGNERLRLLREADAAAPAPQKRQPQLALQRLHHVRHARLGVLQRLRRAGQISRLPHRQQRLNFLAVHPVFRPSL